MKRTILLFSVAILCLLFCLGLVSCEDKYVTIKFNTMGGNTIESIQVEKGGKIPKPSDPEKLGYSFDKWCYEGVEWVFVGYVATEDMTLEAKWTPIEYTIEYVCEGTHSNKTSYTVENGFELSDAIREKHIFLGWYEDKEYTKPIAKIEKGTMGSLTIYGKTQKSPLVLVRDGDEYTVSCWDKNITSVEIPSKHNGRPVTTIDIYGFEGCTRLESITIPNSVTKIGGLAFKDCTSLESITIHSSITKISGNVFKNCANLERIEVDEENKNYSSIDGNLYSKDEKTLIQYAPGKKETSFTVPNSVTIIDNRAFESCARIKFITIPSSVTAIGEGAFFYCESLISVGIENGVKTIGNRAFYYCTNLKIITIPSSVTAIEGNLIHDCARLERIEVDEENKNYSSIDGNLYSKDKKTLIQYASGKKETSFIVPNCVTTIENSAFDFCLSLTSVTIPSSVTKIAEEVFEDCIYVERIEVDKENKNYSSIDGNLYSKDQKTLIRYAEGKKETSFTIPSGVTKIGDCAFVGCALVSITIPNSVKSIGYEAFSHCANLTIYCEAESQPSGWNSYWNDSNCPVVWDYKNK
ncbi:MAG: leucine-rich repeat protein [Clostridia bacterium]|nr:leucine-rich repeat protein [Clostridia bacterium]